MSANLKGYTQYVSKFGKLSSAHRTRKGQYSFQSQGRVMSKNVQTTIKFISFHMLVNLENSAVPTGLEKLSFHSNPKERQCQRMIKLQHNCTHLTHQQHNAQNSPSEASTVCEPGTSRCSSWIQKRQRNQRNCQHPLDHRKSKRVPEKLYFCCVDYTKAFDCLDHNKLWKILQEMGIPDHFICFLRNLYTGQEATVRTGQETMDRFKKGLCQGCIL